MRILLSVLFLATVPAIWAQSMQADQAGHQRAAMSSIAS